MSNQPKPSLKLDERIKQYLEDNGLYLYQEVVSSQEERLLLKEIESYFKEESKQELRTRSTLHFGHRFSPKTLKVDTSSEVTSIPDTLRECIDRIFSTCCSNIRDWRYDQITVNRYLPGGGIGAHVDTHSCFDEYIVIFSLGSPTVMEFSAEKFDISLLEKEKEVCREEGAMGEPRSRSALFPLWLPNRSLLVMSGKSRYLWHHKIPCRKTDTDPDGKVIKREIRVSVTVRRVSPTGVCQCSYRDFCDSQNPDSFHLPDRVA